jgi:hypothetical protein
MRDVHERSSKRGDCNMQAFGFLPSLQQRLFTQTPHEEGVPYLQERVQTDTQRVLQLK